MKLYKNFDTQMKKLLSVAALAGAVLLCSCGGNKTLKMGSLSKFDSLSYALGANIGYGMQYEMSDIPFNFEEVNKGIKEGALDKSKQKHEDAIDILRDYFMNKRGARAFAIQQKKAMQAAVAADSTGMLKDTLPAAEPMFLTPGECDSVSYAFGNDIGNNIKSSDIPVQIVWITEAMANVRDSVAKMDEMIVQGYLQNYFMVVRPRENAEASAKWLEGIAKKSGVEKTESGLLYKIERPGDADTIAVDDRDVVVVNYEGKNRKGKVFDSSYERNEPAEFPLNRVIKGWTEGMKLVGKGGKITLWIPAELAYGERGAGRDIGANEALEFSVEVVDVKPYVEPAPADSTKVAEPAKKESPSACHTGKVSLRETLFSIIVFNRFIDDIMEFEGVVYKIMPVTRGTSARGEWQRQDVVFDYNDGGQFSRKICVTFFNKESDVAKLREGETFLVSVNIESREYNGRWYTDIRAWRVQPKQQQPPVPMTDAPLPSDIPAEGGSFGGGAAAEVDDLPF